MENDKIFWMKIVYIVGSCLLLVIGFGIGYFYTYEDNNSCISNPFIYGITEMGELNNAEFQCSCGSNEGVSFHFNKDKMEDGSLYG